jgi:hypothetical protein
MIYKPKKVNDTTHLFWLGEMPFIQPQNLRDSAAKVPTKKLDKPQLGAKTVTTFITATARKHPNLIF